MKENPLAIILKEIEPDPTAEIFLFVKPNQSADIPTPPFELVHVARVRNYYQLPHFDDKFYRSLNQQINVIQKQAGATKHLLIIREDLQEILDGNDPWKISKSLSKIQFQAVNMTDIFFDNGEFNTVELTLEPQHKLPAGFLNYPPQS